MKPVPSWEPLDLGNVSPARQCSLCDTQGHQLPGCLHVAGIKQFWLAISGPHGPELANPVHSKDPASSVAAWAGSQPSGHSVCS